MLFLGDEWDEPCWVWGQPAFPFPRLPRQRVKVERARVEPLPPHFSFRTHSRVSWLPWHCQAGEKPLERAVGCGRWRRLCTVPGLPRGSWRSCGAKPSLLWCWGLWSSTASWLPSPVAAFADGQLQLDFQITPSQIRFNIPFLRPDNPLIPFLSIAWGPSVQLRPFGRKSLLHRGCCVLLQ